MPLNCSNITPLYFCLSAPSQKKGFKSQSLTRKSFSLRTKIFLFYIHIKFLQYMFTYSTYQYYTTAQHYRDNNMRSKIAWLPHVDFPMAWLFENFLLIFLWLGGLTTFFCEGALRYRNTRELYSKNLTAFGPNSVFSCAHQLQKKLNRKPDKKTRQKDQNKINNQSKICVLTPLGYYQIQRFSHL